MKVFKILMAITIVTFLFNSCDKVEAPYKVEGEKPTTPKNAFLEFYTGHLDQEGPTAMDSIYALTQSYGDQLIVMTVHAGNEANPAESPFDYDFTTEAGTEYYDYFQVQSSSNGIIDRKDFNGSITQNIDDWRSAIDEQVNSTGSVNIKISPNIEENTLSGQIKLEFFEDIASQAVLQIYIIEDSIIKPQQSATGVENNYIHRYNLRDAVNGTWGVDLPAVTYAIDDEENIAIANYELNSEWNLNKLSLIAVVYDKASKTILQSEVKNIVNSGSEPIIPIKKVLLEDYTGHFCSNCPAAHEVAHDLQDLYGEDNLIVVAIHSGFFAWVQDAPLDYDFQTEAGDEYFEYFSVGVTPNGMVDRKNNAGVYIEPPGNWGTIVDTTIKEEALIHLKITPDLNGNQLSGNIDITFINDVDVATNLQLWIVEDDIIKPQQSTQSQGGLIMDYVHKSVLRGTVNGTWGDPLPSSSYIADDTERISFSNYELGDDWVPENLSIIAFLYDTETKRLINVEKIKITE